jgi:hypothetical protein
METTKNLPTGQANVPIPIQLKLAALWTSLMFVYLYVDYFHLYMPGMLPDLLRNRVHVFEVGPGFLMAALSMVSIPALMICLSVLLPNRPNRWLNMGISALYVPFTIYNLDGLVWAHMVLGVVVELVLLGLIFGLAWRFSPD